MRVSKFARLLKVPSVPQIEFLRVRNCLSSNKENSIFGKSIFRETLYVFAFPIERKGLGFKRVYVTIIPGFELQGASIWTEIVLFSKANSKY